MADELIIHTDGGTFRVPVEALEPFRLEEPEVSGFDFARFGNVGTVLAPIAPRMIQPEGGGDDLFSPRMIGETEKNLGPRPWG